jgi:TatA/E family protein of Tat protein translocase
MFPGFHGFDLIIILVILLVIFGPKRLPEMGSAIGKSIKEFRKGMNELSHKPEEEAKLPPASVSQNIPAKPGLGSVTYEGEMNAPTIQANREYAQTETPIE